MAGLEALERLFVGQRRKEKPQKKEVAPAIPKNMFPAPSFIRPTSINMKMKPREERPSNAVVPLKERSMSLPDNGVVRKAPSDGSLGSRLYARNRHSDGQSPTFGQQPALTVENQDHSELPPQLSQFKFPEDSLFKNDDMSRPSTASASTSPGKSEADFRSLRLARPNTGRSLSRRSHQRLSVSVKSRSQSIASTASSGPLGISMESKALLPSPIITRSSRAGSQSQSSTTSTSPSTSVGSQGFGSHAAFFKGQMAPVVGGALMDTPPTSDSGEDRSFPIGPRPSKAQPPSSTEASINNPDATTQALPRYSKSRETWGYRLEDPRHSRPITRSQSPEARQSMLRKAASATSIDSLLEYHSTEGILWEPTLDDFLSLSDDDIAEEVPFVSSSPHVLAPPTPPPKDSPKCSPSEAHPGFTVRGIPIKLAPHRAVLDPKSGEMTPPCTPTDPDFLAVDGPTCSPANSEGALLAARIADTYKFDTVYVVSLWPNAGGKDFDPSRRHSFKSTKSSPSKRPDSLECPIVVHPKSKTTGRLLAAYGIDEVSSPFQVRAGVHIKKLGSKQWEPCHDRSATPDQLSFGWTRSFYTDNVSVSGAVAIQDPKEETPPNRGIVFAGFVKADRESHMLEKKGAEKEAFFEALYADAKHLVDQVVC